MLVEIITKPEEIREVFEETIKKNIQIFASDKGVALRLLDEGKVVLIVTEKIEIHT